MFGSRAIVTALALVACAAPNAGTPTPTAWPEIGRVDARVFIPAPPQAGGAAELAELAVVRGPWTDQRRHQAIEDNALNAFAAFEPVLGPGFDAAGLPATRALLRRSALAAGYAAEPVKAIYQRPRPFRTDPTIVQCFPNDERLRESFSYPSGHAAIGFGWALVLSELIPARADEIIERGRDFGWSRVVCGVHYPSDVEAGRVIGAAAIARLHSEQEFQRELAAAREELSRFRN